MQYHRYVVAAPVSGYDLGFTIAVQIDHRHATWLTTRDESLMRLEVASTVAEPYGKIIGRAVCRNDVDLPVGVHVHQRDGIRAEAGDKLLRGCNVQLRIINNKATVLAMPSTDSN